MHSSEDGGDKLGGGRLGHFRTASGHGSLGSVASRSISMNSVSSEGSAETPVVEQEDIIALTQDVRSFKDALGRLRRIFHPEKDRLETARVAAHEKLGEVLRILRSILEKYGPLQSTELLMAAGQLIQQIKGFNFEDEKADPTEFFEAIDQLALAFSSRVSEYLMGDLDTSSAVHPAARTRSCENLSEANGIENRAVNNKFLDMLSAQQIDETLMRLEHGVGVALQRAKMWSKYAKDVMVYIEKRSTLEAEYSRNIAKLAQATRGLLKEDAFLPFQSVYCTALEQDADNANLSQATCSLLLGHKFIEPLNGRRSEHEKTRKNLKDIWQKESKKMQDAVNNLRKARSLYYQRQQEYEKARESLQRIESLEGTETNKLEKKKRLEDEALQKAMEAETTYKVCVVEANERHQNLQKVKSDVLKQVRELILQCDQTMKAATVGYFQLQHTVSAPLPVQFQTLCESSRLYEPGTQYMEFVKRLPVNCEVPVIEPPPFSFEPYTPTDSRLQERDKKANGNIENSDDSLGNHFSVDVKDKLKTSQSGKIWGQAGLPVTISDSDSVSSQSNKSVDTSPYSSPQISNRHLMASTTPDDFDLDPDSVESSDFCPKRLSKAAESHAFRKLKTPSRCRECDCYVYFQGIECTECGLSCHRKCAETLAIQCGHKRLKPKLTTFGVDLSAHIVETQTVVPHLVSRCIYEINLRGMNIKGIYRVSGVKSKVEKLCQSFENGAELVDLTEIHPNVIANVLKLYLRQLPEPLLTFRLYPEFILIAKKYPGKSYHITNLKELCEEVQLVVQKLPQPHFVMLATLMKHLKRVGENSEINNMPASNLGIVFGPTLLRTSEGSASLSSLIDTVHQTRAVELLIEFAKILFSEDAAEKELAFETAMKTKANVPKLVTSNINLADEEHPHIYEELRHGRKYSLDNGIEPTLDENGSGVNSDEDVSENVMSNYSNKRQLQMLSDYSIGSVYDNATITLNVLTSEDKSKSKKNLYHEKETNVYESTGDGKLHKKNMGEFLLPENINNDEVADGDPPLPPPRRYSSNSRRSQSPCASDLDSISVNSSSSLSNVTSQSVDNLERIVIHVQSASRTILEMSKSKENFQDIESNAGGFESSLFKNAHDSEASENISSMSTNCSEFMATSTKYDKQISMSECEHNVYLTSPKSLPMPSPRLSRIKCSDLTAYEADISSGNSSSQHSPQRSHSASNNICMLTDSLLCSCSSPYDALQVSPVPSIPSTSSSLDELDHFPGNAPCRSSLPNEYSSLYATTDSFKNVHQAPGTSCLYTSSTHFADCDKHLIGRQEAPVISGGSGGILTTSEDCIEAPISLFRTALRSTSYPLTDLGSRNSVLRTATYRHRYSPAYSTSSTKSSSSSSPPPDMDEIGDLNCVPLSERPSPKPIPRTSIMTAHHNMEPPSMMHSSSPGLHQMSSDKTVFMKSMEHDHDSVMPPKIAPEGRAPRFV